MKQATDLLKAGKLSEAIQAVIAVIKEHPTDDKARTFLLNCCASPASMIAPRSISMH